MSSLSSKRCVACNTELEIYREGGSAKYVVFNWYCPKCGAGCGYLTDLERVKYGVDN